MSLYNNIKQRKRSALTILLTSVILGYAYPLFADDPEDWIAKLNGFLIGLLGGITIILFELHVFFLPRKIYSFTIMLISKVMAYSLTFILLILTVVSFTRSLEKKMSFLSYLQSDYFYRFVFEEDFLPIVAYTFSAVILVITTRQISRKMGPGELVNYIIGKYHKPKREHRIFLGIDLQNSTAIAEQLGELKFHEFLKRCFYDLTHSIIIHDGQIYRYVGDQVMISWLLNKGLKNSNSVRCYFNAQKFFEQQEKFYLENFGLVPQFRGVLDMGEVLTAEIGLDKQQLVFYGDVMQRIEAIEKICKRENQNLLLSEYLAVPLKQTKEFEFTFCTNFSEDGNGSIQLLTATPLTE